MNPNETRMNAQGHLVPVHLIKPIDQLRDDTVLSIIEQGKELRLTMANKKAQFMNMVNDFVDLSAEQYGLNWGGKKGNVSLTSFCGNYRVQKAKSEHRVFDERIQAAKAQIDSCIERWAEGASDQIKALVEHAFRVNKQGRIDVNQVLSLRQLDISDDEWQQAMEAISDSIQVSGSSSYLRLYEKTDDGSFKQISLDFTKM